jgi:energy-coupling factor transport system permease protein
MLSDADAALLARLPPTSPTPYHALNPLTKAVLAAVCTLAPIVSGGYLVPALVLAGFVVPGLVIADVVRPALRNAVLVTLPIGISVAIVSILGRAGTHVLFTLGPFDATLEGLDFALRIEFRLLVLALTLALFGMTTEPRSLVVDLERRGVSRRLAFAAAATLDAIPALAARAQDIQAAQRARGLDTEGSIAARLRGVLPLAGPAVLGTLHDVETRSLALEARAFDRPGRRHLLWAPADSELQRVARWLLLGALLALLASRALGVLAAVP